MPFLYNFVYYTICNYILGQRCKVIFYQDDEKNCCIAKATEQFFEEVLMKKNKHIGLKYSYIWYYK